jgi:hypothetical protein
MRSDAHDCRSLSLRTVTTCRATTAPGLASPGWRPAEPVVAPARRLSDAPGPAGDAPSAPAACRGPRRCATLWKRRDEAAAGTWTHRAPDQRRAIGSAGERLVHTEEVTGSIPVSPTRSEAMWIFTKLTMGAIPVSQVVSSR